jgi:RNA 3'-terminal phosphate cyclase (ATP)
MITIDGSLGEGGGQILRTALALSLVTTEPFRITKIRAGRKKPGLLRQHLAAVEGAVAVGGAVAEGAVLSSQELVFKPGKVAPGQYEFAVGTAGSATLVLQTVLPPLLLGTGPSQLTIEGGTHNPQAPPFDFLDQAFLPILNRMGPSVTAALHRIGFYPAGGGKFTVTIRPVDKLKPVHIPERGEIKARSARALFSNLPAQVGERELKVIKAKLGWAEESLRLEQVPSNGPGNVLLLELVSEHITEVFAGFGQRGVLAETIADAVAYEVRDYLAAGVPVGEHLADQLLIPIALAGGGSFVTSRITQHTQTNIEIISRFLPAHFQVEKLDQGVRVACTR